MAEQKGAKQQSSDQKLTSSNFFLALCSVQAPTQGGPSPLSTPRTMPDQSVDSFGHHTSLVQHHTLYTSHF